MVELTLGGMEVEIEYFADPHDQKIIEIESVQWRGLDVMGRLNAYEMALVYEASYEAERDSAICAAENRADEMRDCAFFGE